MNYMHALESARRLLDGSTSSTALHAGAEQARGTIRALDEEMVEAPQREANVLAALTPGLDRRPKSIADIVTALTTLETEEKSRAGLRKAGAWLAAQLDARAREAEKAEAARDKARKPFETQTKWAQDYALRVAEGMDLFKRIAGQFKADIIIAQLGDSAWSRAPRPKGGYDMTFAGIVERKIATPAAMASVRLPGISSRYFEELERAGHYEDDDSERFGAVIAQPMRELRDLIRNHDQRRIVISDDSVHRTVGRAQAALVAEYGKACGGIRELLALDAQITATDRDARYPDGALIFDPKMFPDGWRIGFMKGSNMRYPPIALPGIGSAMAA